MIDPLTKARQRWGARQAMESVCACGTRTRDRSGMCRVCRMYLPKVPRLTDEHLIRLAAAVKTEITKRRSAFERAIKGLE